MAYTLKLIDDDPFEKESGSDFSPVSEASAGSGFRLVPIDEEPFAEAEGPQDDFTGRFAGMIPDIARKAYIGEESLPVEEFGRGAVAGTLGLAESVGTAGQYLGERLSADKKRGALEEIFPGFGKKLAGKGKEISQYWRDKATPFEPPEAVKDKNVWDDPELLKNASWWTYNVGQMLPSLAASILPGAGATKLISVGGTALKWSPQLVSRLATLGGMITGGAAGGSLEASSTYQQVLKEGGSEKEAARSAEAMFVVSGTLNALSTGQILKNASGSFVKRLANKGYAGLTEGVTEGLEEPGEVLSKYLGKYLSGEKLPDDLKKQLIASLKDALTVAPIAALTGVGAATVTGQGRTEPPATTEAEPPPFTPEDFLSEIKGNLERGIDPDGNAFTLDHVLALKNNPAVAAMGIDDDLNRIIIDQKGSELDKPVMDEEPIIDLGKPIQPYIPTATETAETPQAKAGLRQTLEAERAEKGAVGERAGLSAQVFKAQESSVIEQIKGAFRDVTESNQDALTDEAKQLGQRYGMSPDKINQAIIEGLSERERDTGVPFSPEMVKSEKKVEAKIEPAKAEGKPVAAFHAYQQRNFEDDAPGEPLFNVTGGRLDGSSVGLDTLKKEGIEIPEYRKPNAAELMPQIPKDRPVEGEVSIADEVKKVKEAPKPWKPVEDVFTEFQLEKPDFGNISDSLKRVAALINKPKAIKVLRKENPEMVAKLIAQYSKQPTKTKAQLVSKYMILSLLKGEFEIAKDMHDLIRAEGKGWSLAGVKDEIAEKERSTVDELRGRVEIAKRKYKERQAETALKATNFRSYVRAKGGVNLLEKSWAGEIRDAKKNAGWQPGVVSKKGIAVDELLAQAKEDGWGDTIKTEQDLLDALVDNSLKPDTIEKQLDQVWEGYIDEQKRLEEDADVKADEIEKAKAEVLEIFNGTFGPDKIAKTENILRQAPWDLTEEEAVIWEAASRLADEGAIKWPAQEHEVRENQIDLFGPKQEKGFELTPEEGTKYEKIQGQVERGERSRPAPPGKKAVFPKTGIKTIPGKQKGLFPTEGENYDLFDQSETKEITFTPVARKKLRAIPVAQRVRMATTGSIRASGFVVRNMDDAAALLAPIRKAAQEHLYLITVDSNGTVLEIHRAYKGAKAVSVVLPTEAAGHVLNIDDAKTVYYVHNHPSTDTIPSGEDYRSSSEIQEILELKNIKAFNFIIGKDTYRSYEKQTYDEEIKIRPTVKKHRIPIKERTLVRGEPGKQLEDPLAAIDVLLKDYGNKDGFLFVDRKNKTTGFLPFTSGTKMKQLSADLIRFAERTNSSGVIFNSKEELSEQRDKYLKAFFVKLGGEIELLDIISKGTSYANQGKMIPFKVVKPYRHVDFGVAATEEALYSTGAPTEIPLTELSTDLLQKIPGVIKVTAARGGGFRLYFPGNKSTTITMVRQTSEGRYVLGTRNVIKGKFVDGQIEIVKGEGDQYTITHELEHWMESIGVIGHRERMALNSQLGKDGKKATREARAAFVEEAMKNRAKYRETTIGKIIQKIQDFLDSIVNAFRATPTAKQIVRDIESGKIFSDKKSPVFEFAQSPSFSLTDAVNKITDNPAFKKWFGKSKVVDEAGDPLVVFHGTGEVFDVFDLSKTGTATDYGWVGKAFYFNTDPAVGSQYAERGEVPSVLPVYLRIEKPLTKLKELNAITREVWGRGLTGPEGAGEIRTEIIKRGYDGVAISTAREVVAFNPTQIKSIFNRGTWSETDPRIQYSTRTEDLSEWSDRYMDRYLKATPKAEQPKARQKFQEAQEKFDEEHKSDLLESFGSIGQVIKKRSTNWKKQKPDTTVLDRIFSVPLDHFRKVPALGRMFASGLKRTDNYYQNLNNLTQGPDGQYYTRKLEVFRKQEPEEFKKFSKYLIRNDRNQKGYHVKLADDGQSYDLTNPRGMKVGNYLNEAYAWEQAIKFELHDFKLAGYSDQAVDALESARRITNNGFGMLIQNLKDLVARYEALDIPLPTVVVKRDNKSVEVNLKVALAEMGDMRGYYYPRIRRPGQFEMRAKKEGVNPIIEFFDTKIMMARRQNELERQGYSVEKDLSQKLPEDVFEMAGEVVAMQATINEALNRIKTKGLSLEDFGLTAIDRRTGAGTRDFIVSGPYSKRMSAVFKEMGGGFFSSQPREPRSWHFTNPGRNFEQRLSKALMNVTDIVDQSTQALFAKALAEQVANVIKARGVRAHMIKRQEVKGVDVWTGYEEDPAVALAKYASGLASGEAKKTMALETLRAFTGTDISWREYKAENETEDHKPQYEEYLEMVDERRIDAVKQPNAFREGKAWMEDMLRNDETIDRVMGAIKGAAVLKYLAGRVSAPVVNLTALATSVPAAMNGYANIPISKVPGLLGKASVYYGRYKFGDRKLLPQNIVDLFDQIEEKGWHKAQFNRESLSVLESKIGYGYNNLIEWSMFAFGASEQLNRVSTIAGAYLGIKEKTPRSSFDHESALKQAKEISDRAHGVYGKANLPHWARGSGISGQLARSFYVFKTFSHNYLLTMKDLGLNQGQAKAALYMAVSPAILGGAGAFVGGKLMINLVNLILKAFDLDYDDPEEAFYDWLLTNMGEYAERFARYGLFGLAGVSLKGSLEIGIGDIPTTLKDILGAPGSIVEDVFVGAARLAKGDVMKGAEKILPTFAGAPVRAYREATQGLTTGTNAPTFYGNEHVVADTVDSIFRTLSFNPARIATVKEKQWKERKVESAYSQRSRDIYAKLKKFYLRPAAERSQTDLMDIHNEIREYNERLKSRGLAGVIPPITKKSIKTNLKRSFKPTKKERARRRNLN